MMSLSVIDTQVANLWFRVLIGFILIIIAAPQSSMSVNSCNSGGGGGGGDLD